MRRSQETRKTVARQHLGASACGAAGGCATRVPSAPKLYFTTASLPNAATKAVEFMAVFASPFHSVFV